MFIESIRKSDEYDDIVIVRDLNAAEMRYRMGPDGVLRPGSTYIVMAPGCTVHMFLPLPAGLPEVLKVVPT